MIKTSVEELSVGMHVAKLDRAWLDTSLLRHSFLVTNQKQLNRLKAQCEFVFIDPDKSVIVPTIKQTIQTESIKSAANEINHIKKSLVKFFGQLQQGIYLDTKLLIPSIGALTYKVFDKTDTYLYLAKLKAKDDSLAEKSMRVFIFFLAFAKHIGIKKKQLLEIATAAILHDIGMIQVPRVLLKTAYISKDERKYIEQHTNIGVDLLSKEDAFSKLTLDTIKHHHENIDGSGYPDGLKGRDIGLYARMLNITCMYEALTRDRIYKKATSPIGAVKILAGNINSKLDHRLTLKFIETLGVYPLGSIVKLISGAEVTVQAYDQEQGYRVKSIALNKSKKSYFVRPLNISQLLDVGQG